MTTPKDVPALTVKGRIYVCPLDPPLPCGDYVYQGVKPGLGNIPSDPTRSTQIRRYVTGTNPNTPAQAARRASFRDGVAEWHTFSSGDKIYWRTQGRPRNLSGFNAFMSFWMKTH